MVELLFAATLAAAAVPTPASPKESVAVMPTASAKCRAVWFDSCCKMTRKQCSN